MPAAEVEGYLAQRLASGDLNAGALAYVNRYMSATAADGPPPFLYSRLLADDGAAPEAQPALAGALESVDFAGLLRESFEKCEISLR